MQNFTSEGLRLVETLAERHGLSRAAGLALLEALVAGGGRQAQFNHPDLGGMGQWSQGGMIMIGDMFNNALKARVDSLCRELADILGRQSEGLFTPAQSQSQGQGPGAGASLFVAGTAQNWWPDKLGSPSSVGVQNNLRYAYFPAPRRLAIEAGGRLRVFDTGEHSITGFSQQQGGDQSLTFTSQHGLIRLDDLPEVTLAGKTRAAEVEPSSAAAPGERERHASSSTGEILAAIERLAELRQKNILSEEEFSAKKAELLGRL
jgi:hypothetical protein